MLARWVRTCGAILLAVVAVAAMTSAVSSAAAASPPGGGEFSPSALPVTEVAVQPDGGVLVATTEILHGPDAQFSRTLLRYRPDGTLDNGFTPIDIRRFGYPHCCDIRAVAATEDGRVLVGGQFDEVNRFRQRGLVRLFSDGRVDESFRVTLNGDVNALAVQPDGKTLVAGNFWTVSGEAVPYLARLNEDGSVDERFRPGLTIRTGFVVEVLAVQPDGKVLVGGTFSEFAGRPATGLVRLDADGGLDSAFAVDLRADSDRPVEPGVLAVAVDTDGTMFVGGDFAFVNGQRQDALVRLSADGDVDLAFAPILEDRRPGDSPIVWDVATAGPGQAAVVGKFSHVNGVSTGLGFRGAVRLGLTGATAQLYEGLKRPGVVEKYGVDQMLVGGLDGLMKFRNAATAVKLANVEPPAVSGDKVPGRVLRVDGPGSWTVQPERVTYTWRLGRKTISETAEVRVPMRAGGRTLRLVVKATSGTETATVRIGVKIRHERAGGDSRLRTYDVPMGLS